MPIGIPGSAVHRRRWVFIALTLVVGVGIAVVAIRLSPRGEESSSSESSAVLPPSTFDPLLREKRFLPVAVQDEVPLDDPRVSPDDQVVGVSVGGKHRAYALKAFAAVGRHVVNDLFGSGPVTVSHCPRTQCTRVFFNPKGRERLQVAVGGFYGSEGKEALLLRVGMQRYHQETGNGVKSGSPFPYQLTDYKLTTWREWRRRHPDSDIYAGPPVAP